MKKIIILTSALIALQGHLHADPQEVYGRSFMYTRPASDHIDQRQHAWHNIVLEKKGSWHAALQLITFLQGSLSRKKFGRYFLPVCHDKNNVLVSGDANTNQLLTRDVRAEYVGLPADFSGFMTLNPQQTQWGLFIEYSQDLQPVFNSEYFQDTWFNINMAMIGVENDIGLCTFSEKNFGTTFPHNIREAFNQPSWCAAKIQGKHMLFRPSEIQLILGRTYLNENHFQISYYSVMLIPTGNKPTAAYLFSPSAGNNQHVGLGGGVNFQLLLNRHPEDGFAWTFFLDMEGMFRIRNNQHRTFDLKCRPWSRYLPMIRREEPLTIVPGVNMLTIESVVRSYGVADFAFGWRLETASFEFEFGYSIWGHGDEKVKFRDCFPECCNGEFGIASNVAGKTASLSTIARLADPDDDFIGIRTSDIDFHSAEARTSLAQKAHAAVNFHHEGTQGSAFIGFGSFIDLEQKNSDLSRWGAWFKVGGSF